MLPTRWIHQLGQWARSRTARDLAQAGAAPGDAQRARLFDILGRNANTAYGRAYDFASIDSEEAFRARVPIVTPDDIAPWIDRTMAGERQVLTAEKPVYYVRTTGSTGAQKHVPITASYRREYQRSLQASLWHQMERFPDAFTGKALYFVGALQDDVARDGCSVGSMSGFNYQAMPKMLHSLYAWPSELFSVSHLPTRNFLALYIAIPQRVTFAACIFPVVFVQLLRALEDQADRLGEAFATGTLPDDLMLTSTQRSFFERYARSRPELARRMAAVARAPRIDKARLAFPALRLVMCWTGATAALYVPELRDRLGPQVAIHDAVFSAAEGWCNAPLGDEQPGGPLAVTGHYMEFIEESAFVAGSRDAVGVDDVKVGERYAIVLTTSAGLYRYSLGDIVEVYDTWKGLPCIRFVRKAGANCSLVGEKLDEAHINTAMARVTKAHGLTVNGFTVAPVPDGDARYALILETPEYVDSTLIARAMDEALKAGAHDYAGHRADGTLRSLIVRTVPDGTWAAWQQERSDEGAPVAQAKAAHLVDDMDRVPTSIRHAAGFGAPATTASAPEIAA